MSRSILQDRKECFLCGTTYDLHEHHVIYGPFRHKAEHYGLKVYLCAYDHNMSDNGVHFNKSLDIKLKQFAQEKFESKYSHEEWMKQFEKNYV